MQAMSRLCLHFGMIERFASQEGRPGRIRGEHRNGVGRCAKAEPEMMDPIPVREIAVLGRWMSSPLQVSRERRRHPLWNLWFHFILSGFYAWGKVEMKLEGAVEQLETAYQLRYPVF
jgi:hypothetical protein